MTFSVLEPPFEEARARRRAHCLRLPANARTLKHTIPTTHKKNQFAYRWWWLLSASSFPRLYTLARACVCVDFSMKPFFVLIHFFFIFFFYRSRWPTTADITHWAPMSQCDNFGLLRQLVFCTGLCNICDSIQLWHGHFKWEQDQQFGLR